MKLLFSQIMAGAAFKAKVGQKLVEFRKIDDTTAVVVANNERVTFRWNIEVQLQ